jgi:cytochrome c556
MRNTVGAVSLLVVSAFQVEQPGIVESLMKAKAGYAHRLLDAVVKGDLETARGQAFRLKAVAETADWNVMSTPDYARETEEFVRATDRLLRAAETRNLDAVALAYVQVTLSCVRCHRYVRSHR